MPFFDSLTMLPEDPIFSLNSAFTADSRTNKVNLGIGTYKTAEGKPMVLSSIKKAGELLSQKELNKEYLPIDGFPEFIAEVSKLVFGKDSEALKNGHIYGAQTIGGTGALRVGGDFLASEKNSRTVYLSDPTWVNHKGIFSKTGMKINTYPYYDQVSHRFDFTGMCEAIKNMSEGDIILLHGCCHNPTGIDPTFEQWKQLSELIKSKKVIPFFDLAYQGFDQGIEEDAKAIRYFVEQGHELLVASSCSKNFGLYCERVGALFVVTTNPESAKKVGSHIKSVIRGSYSTPPAHGAYLVAIILQSQALRREWEQELANMRERIKEMRKALAGELLSKEHRKDFSFLTHQSGIFSFSGLDQDQVHRLRQENAIYMPSNGRINVAGLNWQNLNTVVDSILSVL